MMTSYSVQQGRPMFDTCSKGRRCSPTDSTVHRRSRSVLRVGCAATNHVFDEFIEGAAAVDLACASRRARSPPQRDHVSVGAACQRPKIGFDGPRTRGITAISGLSDGVTKTPRKAPEKLAIEPR